MDQHEHKHHHEQSEASHGSMTRYIIGLILSILFTLLSYIFVVYHVMHGWALIITIGIFAAMQLAVQLLFFLHMGRGKNQYWDWAAFAAMVIILLIIVIGSIWIMNNLNYNMMSPHDMNEYMLKESNKGF